MTNTVFLSQALPGAGKTQEFIDDVADDGLEEHIVFALPTLKLVNDIHERLLAKNVPAITVTSETMSGIASTIEQVLDDREGLEPLVLLITHVALKDIDPLCLKGWKLVVDEVPDITNSGSTTIGKSTFAAYWKPYVDIAEDGLATIKEGQESLIDGVAKEHMRDKLIVGGSVLNALCDCDVDVYVSYQKGRDRYMLGCVGYHDYIEHFRCADEAHLMGHAVERSLLYLHLKASGFEFRESKYHPEFKPYNLSPTLVPLYSGNRFSKAMLLTNRQGQAEPAWTKDVSGAEAIDNAMGHNGEESILTQVHSWCEYDFSEEHMIETGFDARGLNTFSGVHRTLNLIHGNSIGVEDRLNTMMLEKMGIDEEAGKAAIRYSRCLEMIIQHICRTSIRTFEQQTVPTVHYVPNEDMAEQIAEALKIECVIDRSIMIEPPSTNAKAKRENKKSQAMELLAEGKRKTEIADFLGVSRRTVTRWLKAA